MKRITARQLTAIIVGLVVLAGAPRAVQAAEEFVLVRDGVARAPIVIFEDAPRFTRGAADELADYIGKMSGATPEVIEGEPDPIPEHAVWVGYQPAMDDLFPDIDFNFRHPEEVVIAANENHLAIAGRDRWDPDHLEKKARRHVIKGWQQEYGTANAVYTFLQDKLGVRWLWPGETGTDIPERETITVKPFVYRHHPQIRQRDTILRFSALRWSSNPYAGDWTRLQRMQLDSLNASAGHGFGDWWERFHEDHPEYFALQPGGGRTGYPRPHNAKMCQSNPALWEQWFAEVDKKLQEDPTQTIFNAAPNDSWLSGHCMCPRCKAWDHPDGELRGFRWASGGKQYVALSDRHITFANILARGLKERYPGRHLYVSMIAYGHSRPAPIEAVPEDNVIIVSVANFILRPDNKDRGSTTGKTHREELKNWGKVARNMIWRPNTGGGGGWRRGGTVAPLRQTIEDFRFIADAGCIGIAIDSVWNHFATQGPMYYLMAQLAWNPYADGEAIVEDFLQRAYGPAADAMTAYWRLVEENPGLPTQANLEEAGALLARAAEEAEQGPEKYRRRVAYTHAGFEYVRLLAENRELVKRLRESDGADKEADRQARANWEKIEDLSREYPYALNWFRNHPRHGRTAAFHPDGRDAEVTLVH